MLISQTGQRPPNISFTRSLNRQLEPDFVPKSVEDAVDGMTFRDALRTARPETDRVTTLARANPAGDALLLNYIDKVPVDLMRMTWAGVSRWVTNGDGAQDKLNEAKAGYKIGEQAPLDLKALMTTLNCVMDEFPDLEPHISAEHTWTQQGKDFQGLGYWSRLGMAILGERPMPMPTLQASKLLWSLGIGITNVIMPTGQEPALKDWILEQKPASVELHDLFRESYKLNKGDLYGTLLSAENVLAEGLYDPNRQDREVTKRLSYLRSDSGPQGDNFGTWYHLMGSALYSLMRPQERAELAMKIEGLGSLLLEGKDAQEDHINDLGVKLGVGLRGVAQNGIDRAARPEAYVNTTEFGWDRKSSARFTVPFSPAA